MSLRNCQSNKRITVVTHAQYYAKYVYFNSSLTSNHFYFLLVPVCFLRSFLFLPCIALTSLFFCRKMRQYLWSTAVLVCLLAVLTGIECRTIRKRAASIDSHEASTSLLSSHINSRSTLTFL